MREKSRMLNGESYHAADPKLVWERDRAARILHTYNKRTFHEMDRHNRLLRKLLHTEGNFWIKPPFHCDYGYNIYIGKNVMLNYGCVLLDVNPIVIGEDTLIGAGSVVTHDIEANTVAYGNPCWPQKDRRNSK